MKYRYGIIGTGNMGVALARALAKKVPAERKILSNRTPEKAQKLADELGAACGSNRDAAAMAQCILLAVKPQVMPAVLADLQPILAEREDVLLVTMAAGKTMKSVCTMAGRQCPVIRIMPNTPAEIGRGVILTARNSLVDDEAFSIFHEDLADAGTLVDLEEEQIDAASVISGCGPAYIFMFINAMKKAGISLGLPEQMAQTLAEATAAGSALLSIKSGEELDVLTDNVCSPGGSTIEGVKSFRKDDLDAVTQRALKAAYDRTLELSR